MTKGVTYPQVTILYIYITKLNSQYDIIAILQSMVKGKACFN